VLLSHYVIGKGPDLLYKQIAPAQALFGVHIL